MTSTYTTHAGTIVTFDVVVDDTLQNLLTNTINPNNKALLSLVNGFESGKWRRIKQILGGASGIISGLGAMRNKLGDAHGVTKTKIKPKERHGELAVNLASSMALFIYKTYKERVAK